MVPLGFSRFYEVPNLWYVTLRRSLFSIGSPSEHSPPGALAALRTTRR
jgi:hypothetical protein